MVSQEQSEDIGSIILHHVSNSEVLVPSTGLVDT